MLKNSLGSYFGLSSRQLVTITILGLANIFSGTVVSILAPFYPAEASLKGATSGEYGFVFGIFHLTMAIAAPVYGALLGRISPCTMFSRGITVTGLCSILFGFLAYIDDHLTFIGLSFVLRIVQALGHSANIAASFTLITQEFPETFATTFASLETCFGLGLILGPVLGGILYEVGNFPLPFMVMGALLMTTATVSCFLITPQLLERPEKQSDPGKDTDKPYGFVRLVKVPGVFLAAVSIAISSCSIGFLQSTLQPFLETRFGLSAMYTGFVFMIDGAMYTIWAPIWGRLCDRWIPNPKFVTLAGCLFTFTGFLLMGPAPGVSLVFPTSLDLTCIGLAIHGLGTGASFVSAFIQGIQDSVAAGFPNSVSTYGLVSGLWVSGLAFGSFIGPIAGGLLEERFTFSQSTVFVLLTNLLMAFSTVLFIRRQNHKPNNRPASPISPLLEEGQVDSHTPLIRPSSQNSP